MMSHLTRRELLKLGTAMGSVSPLLTGCNSIIRNSGKRQTGRKVIILGFDGMDPAVLQFYMEQGKLPSFRKLRDEGDFRRLRTSLPPQSPVAWSNFITGMDPGGHGIFDFIHRTPGDYVPYLSTSRATAAEWSVSLGDYVLPVIGGKMELLRKGRAFWQILEDHDVPATIVQIPSNFPPAKTSQRTLSGMGTPDILGTYGIFTFYTTRQMDLAEDIGGGKISRVQVADNVVDAELEGPPNSFRKSAPPTSIRFRVYLDPVKPIAKIRIQDHEFILKQGEWSSWKRIRFPMVPTQSVQGICQFYMKEVRPEFQLYVSPVNLDPASPALPISTPAAYSKELESHVGPFFTKGLPADTKALDHGVLDEDEFLALDESVLDESRKLFEYELARFESGLWFHYFSSTDQRQHMFMPAGELRASLDVSGIDARHWHVIERAYVEMDDILGRAMTKVDHSTLLMVMSDHGFMPFRRSFNLNTWLLQNGYMRLLDPAIQESPDFFANTDWSRTKAYALGLNGLYLNQRGREGKGIVEPGSAKTMIEELAGKLEGIVDPLTGEHAIARAYIARQVYHGPEVERAPDIIVGYNRKYRASWATPLGRAPKDLFENNETRWGADHCMDPEFLPGILLMNRKVRMEYPALYDLTATLLNEFDIERPPELIGRNIF
jgi:predicted AlkP superfamily phosphohydrolase/phosphomutase